MSNLYQVSKALPKVRTNSIIWCGALIILGGGGIFFPLKYGNVSGLSFSYTVFIWLILLSTTSSWGAMVANFGQELRYFNLFKIEKLWPTAIKIYKFPIILGLFMGPIGLAFTPYLIGLEFSHGYLFGISLVLLSVLYFVSAMAISVCPFRLRLQRYRDKILPYFFVIACVAVVILVIKSPGSGIKGRLFGSMAQVESSLVFTHKIPFIGPVVLFLIAPIFLLREIHSGAGLPLMPCLAFACITAGLIGIAIILLRRWINQDLTQSARKWYHHYREMQLAFYQDLDAQRYAWESEQAQFEAIDDAPLKVSDGSEQEIDPIDVAREADGDPWLEVEPTGVEQETGLELSDVAPDSLSKSAFVLPQGFWPEVVVRYLGPKFEEEELGGGAVLGILIFGLATYFTGWLGFPITWLVFCFAYGFRGHFLVSQSLDSWITPQRMWVLIVTQVKAYWIPLLVGDLLLGLCLGIWATNSWWIMIPALIAAILLRILGVLTGIQYRCGENFLFLIALCITIFCALVTAVIIDSRFPHSLQVQGSHALTISMMLLVPQLLIWIMTYLVFQFKYNGLFHLERIPRKVSGKSL